MPLQTLLAFPVTHLGSVGQNKHFPNAEPATCPVAPRTRPDNPSQSLGGSTRVTSGMSVCTHTLSVAPSPGDTPGGESLSPFDWQRAALCFGVHLPIHIHSSEAITVEISDFKNTQKQAAPKGYGLPTYREQSSKLPKLPGVASVCRVRQSVQG